MAGSGRIGVGEAAERLGRSVSTVRRMVDAYVAGDRSDYALCGGVAGAGTHRYVDEAAVERLRRILAGEIVTAEGRRRGGRRVVLVAEVPIAEDVWLAATAEADRRGEQVADVVGAALRAYVGSGTQRAASGTAGSA